MKKILIWGTSICYEEYISSYKYHELIGNIKVIGVTSNDDYFVKLDDYKFIRKEDIKKIEFDYLVIASIDKFIEIKNEANNIGITDDKIIHTKIFKFPLLDLDKYIKLKKSNISIISNNCWGGITYNRLGLKFNSPFINMYQSGEDYLKILYDLQEYINSPLEFFKMGYDTESKIEYPICLLKDVKLHLNHISDFSEGKSKWDERVKRFNMDNLFVMMYTENPKLAFEFNKLNYSKKICFVPFESDLPSSYYLSAYKKSFKFWKIVNGCATGQYKIYDPIELLLTGKAVPSKRISI